MSDVAVTTPVVPAAPLVKPGAVAAPEVKAGDAKPAEAKPTDDPQEMARKVRWEKQVRAREDAVKKAEEEGKTKHERFSKFDELVESDPLGALRVLKGEDFVDNLLRRVNEDIIRQAEEESNPARAEVRKALDEERKERERKDQEARDKRVGDVKGKYLTTMQAVLDASDAYPGVTKALATGKITGDQMFDVALAWARENGKAATYEELLTYCEERIAPKSVATDKKPEEKATGGGGVGISDLNGSAAEPTEDQVSKMTAGEYALFLKKKMGIK